MLHHKEHIIRQDTSTIFVIILSYQQDALCHLEWIGIEICTYIYVYLTECYFLCVYCSMCINTLRLRTIFTVCLGSYSAKDGSYLHAQHTRRLTCMQHTKYSLHGHMKSDLHEANSMSQTRFVT